MEKFMKFIGIDVSKDTLDICIISGNPKDDTHFQVPNSKRGLGKLKRAIGGSRVLVCAEHTGIYNSLLQDFCASQALFYWEESAVQIKSSIGFVRGKSDKVDARRIAYYAFKNRDEAKRFEPTRAVVRQLKQLSVLRKNLLKSKVQIKQLFKEGRFMGKQELALLKKGCQKSLEAIAADIRQCERDMEAIIGSDQCLSRLYKLITSVDGVGPRTAIETIIATGEFKKISCAKKFACYVGVVPFEYRSGSSLHYRSRVSPMANKPLKALYHMASLSAIKMQGELQGYFFRKVEEGKNKMLVVNAIRNKLIQRVFSCVNNDRLYVKCLANP